MSEDIMERLQSFPFTSVYNDDDEKGRPIYDRAVGSRMLRHAFAQFFSSGIFPQPSDNLMLRRGSGFDVVVSYGEAIIDGAFGGVDDVNGKAFTLMKEPPRGSKTYAFFVRLDDNFDKRSLYVRVAETSGSAPAEPEVVEGAVRELRLGYVTFPSNAASVEEATLVDERGLAVCPYAAPFEEIDVSHVLEEVRRTAGMELDSFMRILSDNLSFIASAIDGTAAGNLQAQINQLNMDAVRRSNLDPRNFTDAGTGLVRLAEGAADGEKIVLDENNALTINKNSISYDDISVDVVKKISGNVRVISESIEHFTLPYNPAKADSNAVSNHTSVVHLREDGAGIIISYYRTVDYGIFIAGTLPNGVDITQKIELVATTVGNAAPRYISVFTFDDHEDGSMDIHICSSYGTASTENILVVNHLSFTADGVFENTVTFTEITVTTTSTFKIRSGSYGCTSQNMNIIDDGVAYSAVVESEKATRKGLVHIVSLTKDGVASKETADGGISSGGKDYSGLVVSDGNNFGAFVSGSTIVLMNGIDNYLYCYDINLKDASIRWFSIKQGDGNESRDLFKYFFSYTYNSISFNYYINDPYAIIVPIVFNDSYYQNEDGSIYNYGRPFLAKFRLDFEAGDVVFDENLGTIEGDYFANPQTAGGAKMTYATINLCHRDSVKFGGIAVRDSCGKYVFQKDYGLYDGFPFVASVESDGSNVSVKREWIWGDPSTIGLHAYNTLAPNKYGSAARAYVNSSNIIITTNSFFTRANGPELHDGILYPNGRAVPIDLQFSATGYNVTFDRAKVFRIDLREMIHGTQAVR